MPRRGSRTAAQLHLPGLQHNQDAGMQHERLVAGCHWEFGNRPRHGRAPASRMHPPCRSMHAQQRCQPAHPKQQAEPTRSAAQCRDEHLLGACRAAANANGRSGAQHLNRAPRWPDHASHARQRAQPSPTLLTMKGPTPLRWARWRRQREGSTGGTSVCSTRRQPAFKTPVGLNRQRVVGRWRMAAAAKAKPCWRRQQGGWLGVCSKQRQAPFEGQAAAATASCGGSGRRGSRHRAGRCGADRCPCGGGASEGGTSGPTALPPAAGDDRRNNRAQGTQPQAARAGREVMGGSEVGAV